MYPREIPPTAGLPLRAGDLLPRAVPSLLEAMAAQLQSPELLLTCSGTAAFSIALAALRERAPTRDVVVVPAYTCPLIAIAVHRLGLRLRVCDLAPDTFDMDRAALDASCREDTLAVVPTHLAGLVADTDGALRAASRCGAAVIEDAAQALGARESGRSVGLRGDAGFFSLAAGKGLSIFEGGLLVARDPGLQASMERIAGTLAPRSFAWELRRSAEVLGLAALYRPALFAFAHGNAMRAAIRHGDWEWALGDVFPADIPMHAVGRWRRMLGANAARRWPALLAQRRALARTRCARLARLQGLQVFGTGPDDEASWPFLLLRMPDRHRRDQALARLLPLRLGASRLFAHALPDYAYLAGRVPRTPTPHATDFAERTLTLSNSPWLREDQFETICNVLERSLQG